MAERPKIASNIPKACFVNDKIKVSWMSENADTVEIVRNGSISAVSLNGTMEFNATEGEEFSFIVSNREWTLESEKQKILIYAENHFQSPRFINVGHVLDKMSFRPNYWINFIGQKHFLFPAFLMISLPVVLTFFFFLSFFEHLTWTKLLLLLFATIWTFSSCRYVKGVLHKTSTIADTILFWFLTLAGVVYISSIFRISTIQSVEIEYRLTIWIGILLISIYLISINILKRAIYDKI